MKISIIPKYSTPYGSIEFVPVSDLPGYSHRIAFNGALMKLWLSSNKRPSVETATFFVRVACAIREGLTDQYHYADRKIDPPLPQAA